MKIADVEDVSFGYGIDVDQISGVSADSIFALVHEAPEFERVFLEWVADTYSEEDGDVTASKVVTVDQLLEYADQSGCYSGLGVILAEVMSEATGVEMTCVYDSNCCEPYLLYVPDFPWKMSPAEKDLTEEKLVYIFGKYVRILTGKPVDITMYYSQKEL